MFKLLLLKLVDFFKARSNFHLLIIFIIFGISGSISLFISEYIILIFNLKAFINYSLVYWFSKLILLLFSYQFILLIISFIFGEFDYFSKYSLKFVSFFKNRVLFSFLSKYM